MAGDSVNANKTRDTVRNLLAKAERYQNDVREFERTKKRDVQPTKYLNYERKPKKEVSPCQSVSIGTVELNVFM